MMISAQMLDLLPGKPSHPELNHQQQQKTVHNTQDIINRKIPKISPSLNLAYMHDADRIRY